MSTAYKHLYSCITFLIFIFVLNFYKTRVHVSRERAATKLKRAGTLNRPSAYEGVGEEFLFDFAYLELDDGEQDWQWDRSKQYPGRCLDVEVFFAFPPTRTIHRRVMDGPEGLHYKSTVLGARDRKKDLEQTDSTGSNSSIYMFLSVLVVLLLAAGVDIAKHLTGTGASNATKEEAQRRLSLQNYQALIREKQKQFRMMKQHYSQPSMSVQRSIDESVVPFAGTFSRMDESTPMATMSLAGKPVPAPLLRRQSVPTLMRGQMIPSGPANSFSAVPNVAPFGRRTSVDSFWDVDHGGKATGSTVSNGSSPEVRRRVRMLHRH
uniref:Transmembrane protein n=1 Tax=Anopheles funestus TaxID=62324 RepID=A0A182RR08_ANOFN